jgi:DNA-cytosine methyltransferase
MNHLDLFSGIGGFALAARWAGLTTIQFCEIDPFCQAVLAKNFPGVPIHGDIATFDGKPFRGRVDILTGGFPCQGHSIAGKKKGRDDPRNLWPDLIRVVRDCQPVACLFENVPNLANTMLDEVLRDLDGAGYETEVYCIAAEDIGASHKRERLWIVAYSAIGHARRQSEECSDCERATGQSIRTRLQLGPWAKLGSLADANGTGRGEPCGAEPGGEELSSSECGRENVAHSNEPDTRRPEQQEQDEPRLCGAPNDRGRVPYFPPCRTDYRSWASVASVDASLMPCVEREVRGMDDGLSAGLVRRRRSARNATLKALGNAIVPQIAYCVLSAMIEIIKELP